MFVVSELLDLWAERYYPGDFDYYSALGGRVEAPGRSCASTLTISNATINADGCRKIIEPEPANRCAKAGGIPPKEMRKGAVAPAFCHQHRKSGSASALTRLAPTGRRSIN